MPLPRFPDSPAHAGQVPTAGPGSTRQADRFERRLGWVLWIALALVLFVTSL
jgi:hypothetical protein